MKKFFAAILAIAIATPALAGWFDPPKKSSDAQMAQKAESQMKQIDQMVGFPSVVNGFEKRMVRMLYELRDDPNYRTTTYIVTMTGKYIKVCDSLGYGINASIQFSNPEKVVASSTFSDGTWFSTPQAEPNGLFMPEGLAATYVMCLVPGGDPKNPEIKAVYLEPEIVVSPFPLTNN